ncbi:MAG: hypothetical protein IVW51_18105 [Thermaceae bacterium]|nr:hypothetical protein [Thermaceae bacterium]
MDKSKPTPTPPKPKPSGEAKYSQAEINNRAMGLYFKRYELRPNEMGALNRQATLFLAECMKQATEEMGPAIDFGSGGEITPVEVSTEVQALIDRLASLKASPKERAKLIRFRD